MINRFYQNTVTRLRSSVTHVFGIVDRDGEIVACSDETQLSRNRSDLFTSENTVSLYKPVPVASSAGFCVYVDGTDEAAERELELITSFLQILETARASGNTRSDYIRDLVFGYADEATVYTRLRELGVNYEARRCAAVIHCEEDHRGKLVSAVSSLFLDRTRDYIFSTSENEVTVIRELTNDADIVRQIQELAEILQKNFGFHIHAGIGREVQDLRNIRVSCLDAVYALKAVLTDLGRETVLKAEDAGFSGLIGSIEDIEHFKGKAEALLGLDEEMLFTARKFLENDLDITKTAKSLFINRNTLVYRINRILKATGYDLRKFRDAVTVYTVLMLRKGGKLNG